MLRKSPFFLAIPRIERSYGKVKRYVYISCIMLIFSPKCLELQLAACRLPAWHEALL